MPQNSFQNLETTLEPKQVNKSKETQKCLYHELCVSTWVTQLHLLK